MITITAKRDGFRRAGIAHSKEPTEYPDDRFSKAELKILQAEPMLVVEQSSGDKKKLNVKEAVAFVNKLENLEDLEIVAEGETRKQVLEAIEKRRTELTPK